MQVHTRCTPPRGLGLAWGKVGFPALKQVSPEKLVAYSKPYIELPTSIDELSYAQTQGTENN